MKNELIDSSLTANLDSTLHDIYIDLQKLIGEIEAKGISVGDNTRDFLNIGNIKFNNNNGFKVVESSKGNVEVDIDLKYFSSISTDNTILRALKQSDSISLEGDEEIDITIDSVNNKIKFSFTPDLSEKIDYIDIADDLVTENDKRVLSAKQGVVLLTKILEIIKRQELDLKYLKRYARKQALLFS